MDDRLTLTVRQALQSLQNGSLSSEELTRACIEQIERLESKIHAFITLTAEKALEDARRADARRIAAHRHPDETLPSLLGLPIAVKDLLTVAGVRCTCGSRILENYVPPFTATAVQRLVDAGVVIVGKTNTDEFAMGSSTENSAYGATFNPWDTGRVPGGSSGGSAAAVAARMVPAALGTDTGGSVRQPAAFCGVTGIKPTYGRVSRYGLVAYGSSLDTAGVLAHSAEDAAILFWPMAGFDPLDATTVEQPPSVWHTPESETLKGLRIGVPKEYFLPGMQPEVEEKVRAAIRMLAELGGEVHEISLPHTEYALPVYYLIAPAEASANLARYDGVRFGYRASADTLGELFNLSRSRGFGAEVKRRIMLGTYALSAGYYEAYYGQAQKVRTLIRRDFEEAFQQVDIIATPVTPTTAFRVGEHRDDPLAMYLEDVFTLPTNLAGVPGLAFPVGFDRQGLPVGMQIMASHFREDLLFSVAYHYQQHTDWHRRLPPLL
ncbi:aspartyl/glutamyl-tRNA(Asn/Gln) amidotransferase subunit A [Bellilinea caldifistulae]|uniref:Glutamyl-tRNA(Gln) amidotransferase subunit A n=1 Tax=Bellilinea caldifistulae TaxID=360411 RepID=A0A0P6X7J4_9CHLR|nr:Asp-tRNA(Asn)/Glu-tRNA(Gln) amidotransferase subunit GatA [Bellilinea caldifistulae]KPL76292.1 glutamyl-tRNA amidotransferase [Bellilinea caldifistulae]GAP11962.1 aspartyl/glutamyl-tRNA(Asn/Gln) amidotransferase subunit A [Bellilinea caldifistulae]